MTEKGHPLEGDLSREKNIPCKRTSSSLPFIEVIARLGEGALSGLSGATATGIVPPRFERNNHPLLLQRSIGNQTVQRLFRSGILQAKLKNNQPGDVYEQEGDRVADQVMRMPERGIETKPT